MVYMESMREKLLIEGYTPHIMKKMEEDFAGIHLQELVEECKRRYAKKENIWDVIYEQMSREFVREEIDSEPISVIDIFCEADLDFRIFYEEAIQCLRYNLVRLNCNEYYIDTSEESDMEALERIRDELFKEQIYPVKAEEELKDELPFIIKRVQKYRDSANPSIEFHINLEKEELDGG